MTKAKIKVCDGCSRTFIGKSYPAYNENHVLQRGVEYCIYCYSGEEESNLILFTANDIMDAYNLGREHEKRKSTCTGAKIKEAWLRADELNRNLKFE